MAHDVFTLPKADVENLAMVIKEHVKKTKGPAQDSFCKVWPQAKEGLQLLSTFIAAIPGVGVFAKVAIGIALAAGDAASSAVCK
jgi:hypothetical protein